MWIVLDLPRKNTRVHGTFRFGPFFGLVPWRLLRIFLGGGNGRRGVARGTLFFGSGTVTPGASRECGNTTFVEERPKSAQQLHDCTAATTAAARRVQRASPYRHPRWHANVRNLEKGALEKGYLHEIGQNWPSNLRQFCDNFATILRTFPLMHETVNFVQIWRAICDKFARRPPRKRPLLGISELCRSPGLTDPTPPLKKCPKWSKQ